VVYRPTVMQRPRNKKRDNSRCLVTVNKVVNNIPAIARQLPIATTEKLLGMVFSVASAPGYVTRTSGRLSGHLCGGGVEYIHRDPASRRRRRKGKSQI
jgi:hypothetical protein